MSEREAFVRAASEPGVNRRALCRQFEISPQTGYRWLRRALAGCGLTDRSRRPHSSRRQTSAEMERAVLALRAEQPNWGGRKFAHRLHDLGGVGDPSPSTITAILRRHGQLDGPGTGAPRAFTRFEHAAPNDLWQMDFKGHVACGTGRCHPLTVLDDHSRYDVILSACEDERTATVRNDLVGRFRTYGLPPHRRRQRLALG